MRGGITSFASVLANPRPSMEQYPRPTSPRGRVCAHDGCTTILSVYNHSAFCCLHGPEDAEVPEGCKQCSLCRRVLPLDAFALKVKHRGDTVQTWRLGYCRSCDAKRKRLRSETPTTKRTNYAAYLEKKRNDYYQRRYGYPSKEAYLAAKEAGLA